MHPAHQHSGRPPARSACGDPAHRPGQRHLCLCRSTRGAATTNVGPNSNTQRTDVAMFRRGGSQWRLLLVRRLSFTSISFPWVVPSLMSPIATVLVPAADTAAIDTTHATMDGLKQTKTTMLRTRTSLSKVDVFNKPNASMPTVCEKQWYERNQKTTRGEKGKKHFDFA